MQPGTVLLDRFDVVRRLGSGGAGELLLVKDRKQGNAPCALKVLQPRLRDPGLAPLFRNEFRLLSGIAHESIVSVREFGILETKQPFFTMDFVPGESCRSFVREDRLHAAEYIDLAARLLSALALVHANGILHRDVKPENVIMRRGDGRLLPVLVDFGLAISAAASKPGEASGTIPYIAPEVLAGEPGDPRADLFALGMVLYEVATGKPVAERKELLREPSRVLAPERVRRKMRATARGAVPRRYEDVVSRLLAPSPFGRYPSAAAALQALAAVYGEESVGTPMEVTAAPTLAEAPLVGRRNALEALLGRADALRAGGLLDPIVVVAGPEGYGVTRLLATMRNHASASGCAVCRGASLFELATDIATHPDLAGAGPQRESESPRDLIFRADALLNAAPPDVSPILQLDDVHALDEAEAAALRDWIAALEDRGRRARVLLVLGGRNEGAGPGVELLCTAGRSVPVELRSLAPLSATDVRTALWFVMGQVRIPPPLVQTLERASGGSPRLFGELLRLLVSRGVLALEEGGPVLRAEKLREIELPKGVVEAARARASRLAEEPRRLLARFALVETPLSFAAAAALGGAYLGELLRRRYLVRDRGRVRFPYAVARQAADTLEGGERREALAQSARALAAAEPAAAAAMFAEAGDPVAALELGLPAARELVDAGRLDDARRLLERLRGDAAADALLQLTLLRLGHAAESAEIGRTLLQTSNDAEVLFNTCSALRTLGKVDEALKLMRRFDNATEGDPAARMANAKAAMLERAGRCDEALLESGRAEAAAGSLLGLRGNIAHVRSLVFLRTGRLASARRMADALVAGGAEVSARNRLSAITNRANLLGRRGSARDAIRDFRAAVLLGRESGMVASEGRAWFGLGQELELAGRPASALPRIERARALLEKAAREELVAQALVAEAMALCRTGRPAEAEARLARAEALPGRAQLPGLQRAAGFARAVGLHLSGRTGEATELVRRHEMTADMAVWAADATSALGSADEAEQAWRSAIKDIWRERSRRFIPHVRVGLAQCAAARGAWRLAERLLDRRRYLLLDWRTPLRARALVVRASAAMARREAAGAGRLIEEAVAVANRLDDVAVRAEVYDACASLLEEPEMQRFLREPTAAAAAALLEGAREIWNLYGNETMLRKIDLHLSELPRPAGDPLAGPEADGLVKILHITRELNGEFDRDRLLKLILDRAIELTGAERGFVILLEEGREVVQIARNMDREAISEPQQKVSSRVLREVVESGRIVLSEDAAVDTRFDDSISVRQLRLKSIVAVPFRSGGKTVGALYLDNRLVRGSFSEREERLLELFADQAVVAIEKAEMIRELEARSGELQDAYRRERTARKRKGRELSHARRELKQHRKARGWGFDVIVARSVGMQGVVREAKRFADSDLAILLAGESGTGKEMVARALHYASRRQAMPFLAVNCAAFPEGLLEAELFGHVRGSFTGADRDRAGLFEEANGGTVLLDEVGDMAPSMQVRLLRTLELGEVKRVGESRVRTVDVRVVAATNADLEERIRDGGFREDLYYRLSGCVLWIPPLRERLEDVEPLAYAIVGEASRLEGRPELAISNEAIARLESYQWPGNVRELRNVIMRAAVTAEGDRIMPGDITFDARTPAILPGYDPSRAEEILTNLAEKGYGLNRRQQTAVARVLSRGKLLFAEYQQLFRCSKSTTARDLDALVGMDLLEKRGRTRAVIYLPGSRLRDLAS